MHQLTFDLEERSEPKGNARGISSEKQVILFIKCNGGEKSLHTFTAFNYVSRTESQLGSFPGGQPETKFRIDPLETTDGGYCLIGPC